MLESQGIDLICYLDDFLLFGAPGSPECRLARDRTETLCARLGIPIAHHKSEGPTNRVTWVLSWMRSQS